MRARFWGVRGSVPAAAAANIGFGGNTSCTEVTVAGADPILLDAGTGVRLRGVAGGRRFTLALSHLHWDHIQGLPFFRPLYRSETEITILVPAGEREGRRTALAGQFRAPYFPVAWERLPARIRMREIPAAGLEWQGVRYRCCRLHHPQGAYGFRLEAGGRTLVYALDHEHGDAGADAALVGLARGADVLIGDAQYTPAEYRWRRGWGHSTWPRLAALARRAGVGRLIVSHHDPAHGDAALAAMERAAQAVFPGCEFAREGNEFAF